MTYDEAIETLESQLNELEGLIAEPNGIFCKSQITSMFKNHTTSARANAVVPLYKAVKEVAGKAKGLEMMEAEFPSNSHITELKRRYAGCGQHLIEMINMLEEWGI